MWGPGFKPFWDHWAINPWLGGIKNGPFGTKNGLTWQACQCPDVVQKGPKWSQTVNITYFWPFGTIWTHLHHFGPFKTKINFLPQKHKGLVGQSSLEQKNQVLSEMVQKGPNEPKNVPNGQKHVILTIWDHLGPFWTTSGHWQACHVRPFLVPNGPFLDAPWPRMGPGEGLNDLNPPCHMYKEVPGPFRA